jgi:hypothetical protein
MAPISSRHRAVGEFPADAVLFVNAIKRDESTRVQRVLYINRIRFRSVSAVDVGGTSDLQVKFWNENTESVFTTTIEVPRSWTPRLYVTLLCRSALSKPQEYLALMLDMDKGRASDIGQVGLNWYSTDIEQLKNIAYISTAYGIVIGGLKK